MGITVVSVCIINNTKKEFIENIHYTSKIDSDEEFQNVSEVYTKLIELYRTERWNPSDNIAIEQLSLRNKSIEEISDTYPQYIGYKFIN